MEISQTTRDIITPLIKGSQIGNKGINLPTHLT